MLLWGLNVKLYHLARSEAIPFRHGFNLFGFTVGDPPWDVKYSTEINRAPPQDLHAHGITSPLGHLIHDSDPGLCSQSFWFKIASWPWKFAPLSPLSDSFAMRAVWTVLFFVVAVALRPECLCQITPQRKRCCNLCVPSIPSRLQIALKIINQDNIHGP